MINHANLIKEMGGGSVVAQDLTLDLGRDVDREAVYKWREKNSIPAGYWPAIARIAKRRKIKGVTVEALEGRTS